ncbi:MAG: response regulator [Oligoflexia bacterium]|nr:response regulator [Oligoflexia bacterium]
MSNLPEIYIIDDDKLLLKLLSASLKDVGVITTFNNEEEGLKKVIADRPGLVILDLNLPHINGDELMVKFSEAKIFQTTQIILLTGQDISDTKRMSLCTLGFAAILQKSEGADRVVEAVKETIAEYL